MNLLGLGSYESDDEASGNEEPMQVVTKDITVIANISEEAITVNKYHQPEVKEVIVESKLSYPTSANLKSFNHLHELPPSPKKSSNPKTIRKISEYLELKEISGFNLTENIRSNKNFGNPYIFGKAVEHFQIDEIGSNYPKEIFDPHGYQESDFEAGIKKRYSAPSSNKSAIVKPIPAFTGLKQALPIQSTESVVEIPKKKSRWDSSSSLDSLAKSSAVAAALAANIASRPANPVTLPFSMGGAVRGAGGASAGRYIG